MVIESEANAQINEVLDEAKKKGYSIEEFKEVLLEMLQKQPSDLITYVVAPEESKATMLETIVAAFLSSIGFLHPLVVLEIISLILGNPLKEMHKYQENYGRLSHVELEQLQKIQLKLLGDGKELRIKLPPNGWELHQKDLRQLMRAKGKESKGAA